MSTCSLLIKGKNNPATIYLRLSMGRNKDIVTSTGVSINPKFWDKKFRRIRQVIDVPNRDEINSKLAKLQLHIMDEVNLAFVSGEVIDLFWLKKNIATFFNRPEGTEQQKNIDWKIYLTDFGQWWIDNKLPAHKTSSGRKVDDKTKSQYEKVIEVVKEFQDKNKTRLKLSGLTQDDFDNIIEFLLNDKNYSRSTVIRKIKYLKFLCTRAEIENITVSKVFKDRVIVSKEEETYKHPYLSEDEINAIYKLDLSHDSTLDNARDNFIIGLWTGLRISDFLTRLSLDNIHNDLIEIRTKKTKHPVAIPMHWQIKKVLEKRGGVLPYKIAEQKFNKHIKTICQLAEIDNMIPGSIMEVDKKTKIKRKKFGTYKKYLLVTSHICRRSMATNLFGKVENKVIMDVCGWSSESQMFEYNKATNRDSALKLKAHWDKKYGEQY